MLQAGRKHASLIVKWWMGGLGLAWLSSMAISALISPVLGFVVVIPIVALFLVFGYASSNVEMKVWSLPQTPIMNHGILSPC